MNFLLIPSTPFLMGTPERELSALARAYGGTRESYREESPQFTLTLPAFEIAQTPVTNAQYAAYVQATGTRSPLHWRGPVPPESLLDHPVVDVSWEEANTFCRWLTFEVQSSEFRVQSSSPAKARSRAFIVWLSSVVGRRSSVVYRLPTEAEWEIAARGTDGRTFPWDNTWDASRANTAEAGFATTTPVGMFSHAASPYGCLDMCGNVWEWTASLDALYPYAPRDGREKQRAEGRRILRGGCYANPHGYARCACRFRLAPGTHNTFLGFRLARSST